MEFNAPIVPHLWFDKNAEEAVDFYLSVFQTGTKGRASRYGKAGFEIHKMPEGTLMSIEFTLNGNPFIALNGGPIYRFTPAVSFVIKCAEAEEVDYYWQQLGEGADESLQRCGWITDRFGITWQVVPDALIRLMSSGDGAARGRVMQAMLQMKKLDVGELEKAARGNGGGGIGN